jgi:DNA topoisomerase-3
MTAAAFTSRYAVGQELKAADAFIKDAKTQPPARFTDGTLIDAMTNIHKFITDPRDKQVLKDAKGIGTERTRNNILEGLIKSRGFISRKGQKLISTPEGRELIAALPEQLVNPATTAKWEMAFGLIEEGKATLAQFMTRQETFVAQLVEQAKNTSFASSVDSLPGEGTICPQCGKGTLRTRKVRNEKSKAFGKRFLGCDNRAASCDFTQWED